MFILCFSCKNQKAFLHNQPPKQKVIWTSTDWGFDMYTDSSDREFWRFNAVDIDCQEQAENLISQIEILELRAKANIKNDFVNGIEVAEFIDFHIDALADDISPNENNLFELLVPVKRYSFHYDGGCGTQEFMMLDYQYYKPTDYVLGTYFNAKGEITHLAMER